MCKSLLLLFTLFAVATTTGSAQATVRVEQSSLQGPRALPPQTAAASIRDYLDSWKSLSSALEHNSAPLLDPSFVGTARDKLTETIQQQAALGIHTGYQDRSHDIRIVFYSPEGLSIELTDQVEYDVEVTNSQKVKTTQHVSARYLIVMTPAEVRWRVRVFQAVPE
jgi:hypothetical protein